MLTLIDGNSLLFRAYYGVHSRLTKSDGTPTGAIYGFINMILPILSSAKPDDCIICVFDASRITFRQNIYPAYKQNRSETPEDLITQREIIKQGLIKMGIPVLCVPGVEADDVIATLAKNNCDSTSSTRIITSDKDLMQLVSECTFLYDTMKQQEIRTPQVIEKFGVPPTLVTDVQALMGDSSDNVPGVPGIGPKKASELINLFGSLDNLYNNIGDITNERTRNLLSDNRELAYISKKLVTLKDDVNLSDIKISPFVFNKSGALDFVKKEIESNSLFTKIEKAFPNNPENIPVSTFVFTDNACNLDSATETGNHPQNTQIEFNYKTIHSLSDLQTFLETVGETLSIDTETTGLDSMTSKLVGISLATSKNNGIYIPIRHKTGTNDLFNTDSLAPNQLSITDVHKALWPILTNKNITKIGHNLKYDLHIMANEGWDISHITPIDDTMLLSYVLHGTTHDHSLDELALKYLGHETIKFASLFPLKTKSEDMHFDSLSIDACTKYATEDACISFALYDLMRPELNKNHTLQKLYETCDLPLMPVLLQIERTGVMADKTRLNQLSIVFHKQLQKLESEIWHDAGHEFNIASPKQLGIVLFEELKLPANKKRSTDADTLNDLIEAHPIIEKILSWRSIAKLASTYADALPHQIASDNRIHTTYLQTSTNTGRLSSRDPNLQNIPIKTELGEEIRKCFIASPGNVLISIDYSQIQLRLLADIADIKTFKDTFNNCSDIHIQTARKIFNIPNNQPVPKDMRRAAKTVNFSIIYGISSFGLSSQLGISRSEAQKLIDSYMSGLPEVKTYIEKTKQFALENACVYTPWGRRIELPEIHNPRMRSYAMRAAINAPIQGFEADLMRRAMVLINEKIVKPNRDKIRMIMQVHDEIVFECNFAFADLFATQIKSEMENIVKLSVPLVAEYTIDTKWGK